MSFNIKIPDFDLGIIEIENIFINDFMPSAEGLYVKVYLMALKLSNDHHGNSKFNNESLSNILNVPISDVTKAWEYWSSKSIVNILNRQSKDSHVFDIEFISLRQLFIDKNYYTPNKSNDLILKSIKDNHYLELFSRINNLVANELQANERHRLMEFLDENEICDDLVVEAFNNLKRGAYSSRISTVLKNLFNWIDLKITTLEELINYKEQTSNKYNNYKRILKSLGYPWQNPTSGDKEVIDTWINEYNFDIEFILEKIKTITKKVRNPNMNYLDAIFKSEFTGIRPEPKKYNTTSVAKSKNKFHNFDSSSNSLSEDDLENLFIKNR